MPLEKKAQKSMLERDIGIGRVSLTEKAVFAKHLAVMLSSGLTIWEALDIAEESAKGKMASVVRKVKMSVEAGNPLADSLAKYPKVFSGLFVDVVRAGEQSGTLAENLENIALQLKKEHAIVSKVKSAMAYPAVVLFAAIGLALAMAYYVLPQITPLFTGLKIDLPASTQAVIWFSDLMREDGTLVVLSVLVGIPLIVWLLKRKAARPMTHWVLLNFPIVKQISRNSNLARFSLTLGTLLKSGLAIDEALTITKSTVSNFHYQKALESVLKHVEQGGGFADNLAKHKHLFPKLVTSMVHVGERSGDLDDSLLYLAEFYEAEVDGATKTLTTSLEPMLLIGIGLVVATLALAIITPIYEITGSIRR